MKRPRYRLTHLLIFLFASLGAMSEQGQALGFPVEFGGKSFAPITIADVDNDGRQEILVAALTESGTDGGAYIFRHTGELLAGWPQCVTHIVRAGLTAGNLDTDPELEIVVGTADLEPFDDPKDLVNFLYVFNHDGTPLPGFPKSFDQTCVLSTPVIGEVDPTDSFPEIVCYVGDTRLHAWYADGTELDRYPIWLRGDEYSYGNLAFTSTSALADTDGDGACEIFIGSTKDAFYYIQGPREVYSVPYPHWLLGSPSVADVDRDGDFEVFIGSGDGFVAGYDVFPTELTDYPGWPYLIDELVYSQPALADMDGNDNGKMEIAFMTKTGGLPGSEPYVFVLDHDGTVMPGWPQTNIGPGASNYGSPAVADLDGDGVMEIIAAIATQVYVWHLDGTLFAGFPKTVTWGISSSVAVGDLDGDGRMSILAAQFADARLYEWELSYTVPPSNGLDWPMFGRTPDHQGWNPAEPMNVVSQFEIY